MWGFTMFAMNCQKGDGMFYLLRSGRRYGSFDFTQKGSGPPRYFGDKLLYPPSGKHWIWDQEKIDQAMKEGRIIFTLAGLPRVKRYLDEKKGNYVGDLWVDDEVTPLSANSEERVDFPTQKTRSALKTYHSCLIQPR